MLLIGAAFVVGLFLVTRRAAAPAGGAQEIPVSAGNGWRYFTDGTAIGPDGTYYYKGQVAYDPQAEYRSSF